MFILHAEHEMNCSTAAARHLASSGVDVYTAIGGEGRRGCFGCRVYQKQFVLTLHYFYVREQPGH